MIARIYLTANIFSFDSEAMGLNAVVRSAYMERGWTNDQIGKSTRYNARVVIIIVDRSRTDRSVDRDLRYSGGAGGLERIETRVGNEARPPGPTCARQY